ncbi:MAG: O-antigen ligase family protein [Gemmataceae bacterium]
MLWILIGYMFLFIHRPFEVWPVLGDYHVERIYAIFAMVAVLFHPDKRWIANKLQLAYAVFAAAVFVCWVASPWADQGQRVVEDYFKIFVFYLLFTAVVHDERQLRIVLLAFLAIMFIYMSHSVREYLAGRYTYRMSIARMIGVDKSLGDPNSFGASIVYALPFVVPFWLTTTSSKMKWFLTAYVGLSLVCIGLTGSRSSFVGLVLWGIMTVLRSRRRWSLALLCIFMAPVMWLALPPSLQNRFETIIHPEVGPANAAASGQERIEGLKTGLELWERNVLLGVGPGAWRPATGRPLESHNLYGQVLGEMGTLGGLALLGVVTGFIANVRGVRRLYRLHPEWDRDFLYHLTGSLGLALVLLLFEGNFGHNLYRFNWLWFGGFLIIARYCVQQKHCERSAYAPVAASRRPIATFGFGYGNGY